MRCSASLTPILLRSPALLSGVAALCAASSLAVAQPASAGADSALYSIVAAASARRIEADIRTLVGFGTRHTLSDTVSTTRGIGAARRWIKAEFDRISAACGGCLEVRYVSEIVPPQRRIPDATNVVNVLAVLRGVSDPNRYVIMAGDIDSRVTDVMNAADSSPGANDNASGVAGTLEAARLLSRHRFAASIAFLALSGEEQGLLGGRTVAQMAADSGWNVAAMLNNDMIGNVRGVNGVIDNGTARVFSDGISPIETDRERAARRTSGSDVDWTSRQLARYVNRIADRYVVGLDVLMVYRLDRFGRGGHHTPFANLGFPAVRLMETNENYDRQHQDIRMEDGVAYGDVIGGVDFDYAAKLTALNAATLAALAWAPDVPDSVRIGGAVRPAARLAWRSPADTTNLAGYRVYWRLTDSPTWDHSRWVGDVTEHTFDGLVVDNYYFGVAAVGRDGMESLVAFPRGMMR
jgi:Zn-dependent M28 family amino/carboxypeptidase